MTDVVYGIANVQDAELETGRASSYIISPMCFPSGAERVTGGAVADETRRR